MSATLICRCMYILHEVQLNGSTSTSTCSRLIAKYIKTICFCTKVLNCAFSLFAKTYASGCVGVFLCECVHGSECEGVSIRVCVHVHACSKQGTILYICVFCSQEIITHLSSHTIYLITTITHDQHHWQTQPSDYRFTPYKNNREEF